MEKNLIGTTEIRRELRSFVTDKVQVESRDDSELPILKGYAALFDVETNVGGWFREVIRKGAFTRAVNEKHDVRALVDHNESKILGRTASGTLIIREDEKGLFVEIMPPNTTVGRDIVESIRRGDVSQMSFAFIIKKQSWISGDGSQLDLREVQDLDLVDVSAVSYPQYPETEIGLRTVAGLDLGFSKKIYEEYRSSINTPEITLLPYQIDPKELKMKLELIGL